MHRFLALLFVPLLLSACGGGADGPDAIDDPNALVEAMHARYADDWYETLTFEQETVQYRPDGSSDTSTWYEALALPGRLRIDVNDIADGNGMIFTADSQYVYRDGALIGARPQVHPLMLLGFDVYKQDPAATLAKLDTLGFDLTVLSDTTWQDRPTYIVGARAGDTRTPQFWVDQERLLFTRMLLPVGPTGANIQDIRFNAYEPLGGGWIAPEVDIWVDSTRFMTERYRNVRPDVPVSDNLFAPDAFRTDARYWE